MQVIIVSIHILAAVVLVLTVLLQAGKNAGMGAAFGGSSGSVFGTRGPATLISKITCVCAVIFMGTSLQMAIAQGGLSRQSLMDEYQPAASGLQATPAPAPEAAAETKAEAAAPEAKAEAAPAAETDKSQAAAEAQSDETKAAQ